MDTTETATSEWWLNVHHWTHLL